MKKYSLDIYQDFKCINSKCSHNCCLYWQIDIDKKTLKKYSKINDDFSFRIKEGIDFKNKCFLMQNERCSFLDNDNLCEIIKEKGEGYLCQVCRDHPRFNNYFTDRIESGVGLCCEVIAKRLIEKNDYIKEIVLKNSKITFRQNSFEKEIIFYRNNLKDILFSNKTINEKIELIINENIINIDRFTNYNWKNVFLGLDILQNDWKNYIAKLNDKLIFEIDEKYNVLFSNLIFLTLYRNLSNSFDKTDIKSRTIFSIIFATIVYNVFASIKDKFNDDKNKLFEIIVLISIEVEYSDENINKILDVLDNFVIKN